MTERECEFNYYIVKGSGSFTVNGIVIPCSKGDLVVIPPGNTFTYSGKLKMLLINTPHFRKEQEDVSGQMAGL